MIDPKGSAVAALIGAYRPVGDRLFVDRVIHDAAADVEEGIAFWKTLGRSCHANSRRSPHVSKSQELTARSLQ